MTFGVESKVANVGRWLGLNTKRKASPLPLPYALQAQNVYARPGGIIRRRGFRPAYDQLYTGRITGMFAFEAPCQQLEFTAVAGAKAAGLSAPGTAGDGSDAGVDYPLYTDRFYGWCIDTNGIAIPNVAIECWVQYEPDPAALAKTIYSDANGFWSSTASVKSKWSFIPVLAGWTFYPVVNVAYWGYPEWSDSGYHQTGDPASPEWEDQAPLGRNLHTLVGTAA